MKIETLLPVMSSLIIPFSNHYQHFATVTN